MIDQTLLQAVVWSYADQYPTQEVRTNTNTSESMGLNGKTPPKVFNANGTRAIKMNQIPNSGFIIRTAPQSTTSISSTSARR